MKNSKIKITLDDLFEAHQSAPLNKKDKRLISAEIKKYKAAQAKTRHRRKSRALAS